MVIMNSYHIQCIMPFIGMLCAGMIAYLHGVWKGWWTL